MSRVTRKELVDNVLRPAFTKNDNIEDILKEVIIRLRVMYPEVAEGYIKAVKESKKVSEK
jgi:hypothetical protein